MVDAEVGGGTIEVKRHTDGGVAGIAIATFKGTIFDNRSQGYENVGGYRQSECKSKY